MKRFRGPAVFSLYLVIFLLAPLVLAGSIDASDAATKDTLAIDEWNWVPPMTLPLPVFHDQGKALEGKELLALSEVDLDRLPELSAGRRIAATDAKLSLGPAGGPAISYLTTFVSNTSFYEGSLSIDSAHPLTLFLDGTVLEGDEDYKLSLAPGKHALVLKLLRDPDVDQPWDLSARFEDSEQAVALTLSLDPTHAVDFDDILATEVITGLALSPDGARLAVHKRDPSIPKDDGRSWTTILSLPDGKVIREYAARLGSFSWSPADGQSFSYTEEKDGKSTIWIESLGGSRKPLVKDVEHLAGIMWVPDGQSMVYGITTPESDDDEESDGFDRVRSLEDRWAGYRDKTYLYRVSLATGTRQRLSAGPLDTALQDISPDSRHLIFSREVYDDTRWPFLFAEIWELDLETLRAKRLTETRWSATAQYSPDGKQLLVLGGPSAFGEIGVATPQGVVANEYDTQAYLFEIATKKVTPITRDFDPMIEAASWASGGTLLLRGEEGTRVALFRWDPATSSLSRLPSAVDVISRSSLAEDGTAVAYYGSSVNSPGELHLLDLREDPSSRLLERPDAGHWEGVAIGKTSDFNFKTSTGLTIEGVVHYPPNFDAKKTYPAIVYYYGGTVPVGRSFGGRWPKNVWAAHGYIVYILQPSGATGYGQDFSAAHVNNWGRSVADEIVEGTQAFLAAHPFVDPERVGCMGASYGGFMTELLVSRTKIFSAAVSHAGISSLAGYWGEGWWGYIYSAIATAKKYPWNDQELYIGQSALFHADKIETPLLLLHGKVDTNVPRGQSEQLFTALKILGRDVEFVRIAGENHLIMDYDKRRKWMETIVAWFDWKLKDDHAWWNHLYPAP